jgi:hypothetical protein
MEATQTAGERIVEEVASWPGMTTRRGERGELSLVLGRREIGHLHGDRVLHIGLPRDVWHELHGEGRIDYHPVFPGKPGYGARLLEDERDVTDAMLLRLNYHRAITRHGLPEQDPV